MTLRRRSFPTDYRSSLHPLRHHRRARGLQVAPIIHTSQATPTTPTSVDGSVEALIQITMLVRTARSLFPRRSASDSRTEHLAVPQRMAEEGTAAPFLERPKLSLRGETRFNMTNVAVRQILLTRNNPSLLQRRQSQCQVYQARHLYRLCICHGTHTRIP